MRFQSTKNVIKRVFILPLTRSFSINGLRLTNAKTSFAAGFGLHHWSILEREMREQPAFCNTLSFVEFRHLSQPALT